MSERVRFAKRSDAIRADAPLKCPDDLGDRSSARRDPPDFTSVGSEA